MNYQKNYFLIASLIISILAASITLFASFVVYFFASHGANFLEMFVISVFWLFCVKIALKITTLNHG